MRLPSPLYVRFRPRPRVGSAALLLLFLTACRCADVREDLAQAGFRTPTQTFETFKAAFVSDLPKLEYRCFSADFTSRNGMSQLAYREGREQGLAEQPFLRWGIGRAKIVSEERPAADRARILARSKSLFHHIAFEVSLVREDFYELWDGERRIQDDFLPFEHAIFLQEVDGEPSITAFVPMRDPSKFADLAEVRFGREWKIDDLRKIPTEELPDSPPLPRKRID